MFFIRKRHCKIVYRSEYLTGLHAQNARQSFDVMKFKKIRDQLVKEKLIKGKDILESPRVSDQDLQLVHTQKYLNKLKNPMLVGEILNLDYVNPWDEYIFEYFRYVTGGSILAAQYALEQNTTVFNLGGGYHHAHPDRGEGFCLINDVAIAIRKLKNSKILRYVLIIDLDYHQGNGNLSYFRMDETIFTFSMHADNWIEESGKQNNIDIELPSGIKDEAYLKILSHELPKVFNVFKPELVIYLAGSDPFMSDTLGDFKLSERGLLQRDKYIYREARKRGIPLAVLAAGGYGPESWRIYYNFIKWAIKKGK